MMEKETSHWNQPIGSHLNFPGLPSLPVHFQEKGSSCKGESNAVN